MGGSLTKNLGQTSQKSPYSETSYSGTSEINLGHQSFVDPTSDPNGMKKREMHNITPPKVFEQGAVNHPNIPSYPPPRHPKKGNQNIGYYQPVPASKIPLAPDQSQVSNSEPAPFRPAVRMPKQPHPDFQMHAKKQQMQMNPYQYQMYMQMNSGYPPQGYSNAIGNNPGVNKKFQHPTGMPRQANPTNLHVKSEQYQVLSSNLGPRQMSQANYPQNMYPPYSVPPSNLHLQAEAAGGKDTGPPKIQRLQINTLGKFSRVFGSKRAFLCHCFLNS